MRERFYTNLSSVFGILLHQPESIVDDTAVERLLLILQKQTRTYEEDLITACIAFWEDKELWDHDASLSFALRYVTSVFLTKFLNPLKYYLKNSYF